MKVTEEKEVFTSGIVKKKKPEYKIEYKFKKPSKFFERWGWCTHGKYVRLKDCSEAFEKLTRKDDLFYYRCIKIKTNKIIILKPV